MYIKVTNVYSYHLFFQCLQGLPQNPDFRSIPGVGNYHSTRPSGELPAFLLIPCSQHTRPPDPGSGFRTLRVLEVIPILVEKERTGSKSYREYLESKLLSLKREYENIAQRVSRPKAETGEKEHLYYSAWYYTAIHMLVSIPAYQTVEAISKRLQLPEALIHSVLETLEQFGYVKKENRKWKYLGGEKHISKESPLVALHHNNWRQRAVIDAQSPLTRGLHFSVVQSMSREIHEELHQKLLQFIDEASRLAGPSREEELVAIGIDLFEV
jgi:hypothetical protein